MTHQEAVLIRPYSEATKWCKLVPNFCQEDYQGRQLLNLHPISLYQDSMIHCFTFPRVVVSRAQSEAESTQPLSPGNTAQQGFLPIIKVEYNLEFS